MVLLAEDDEDDIEFIRIALQEASSNHQLHVASNGKEALDFLQKIDNKEDYPCLIVLDLNMPVLDGLQTLEVLSTKPHYRNIPKVIFTTSDSDHDKNRCMQNGATDFLVKPTQMSDIVRSVKHMLGYCDAS